MYQVITVLSNAKSAFLNLRKTLFCRGCFSYSVAISITNLYRTSPFNMRA